MLARLAAAFAFLLACGSAQGALWIVDAANGAGTNFTELQTALASAQVQEGDRLLVRAGSYAPSQTSKGVTILGEPGARIRGGSPAAVTVSGLAAGRAFVLHRIGIEQAAGMEGIVLQNNAGHVHLCDLSFPTFADKRAVNAVSAALVTIHRCSTGVLSGGFGSSNSELVVTESSVRGYPQAASFSHTVTPAITVSGGTLWLSQVQARGGDGYNGSANPTPPAPGIRAFGASLIFAAGSASAGQVGTNSPTPAIELSGSIVIAPSVGLTPYLNAPPIGGGGTVQTVPLPYLLGSAAPPAGTLGVTLRTAPNDSVFLAMALPGAKLVLPFGPTWLDFASLIPLVVGPLPNGTAGLQLPVPNLAELRGLLLAFQAANSAAATSELRLSNPLFLPLH